MKLKNVSGSLFKLKSLEILHLLGCSKLEGLPEISKIIQNLNTLYLEGTAIKELPSSIEHLTQLSTLSLANCKNIASLPNSFFKLTSLRALNLSGLSGVDKLLENSSISVLSGLGSLNELNLTDCDLLELPSALSCLSSLDHFYLSGNNFESLNLKPFSCLESLDISYCKRLQSILGFPSLFHLTYLQAHECISLETLQTLTPIELTMEWSSNHSYAFSNCFKLDEDAQRNILADAQQRIQAMATNARRPASTEDYDEHFYELGASACICLPGCEIPGWFSYQNVGSLITIELPQHWYSRKFLGFALCVVIAFDNYIGDKNDFIAECKCNFEANDGDCNNINCDLIGLKPPLKPIFLCSDHVFLLYSRGLYDMIVQRDDDDQRFSMYQSCHSASFEFSPVDSYKCPLLNCKVRKCGVCLLYLEEEHTGNVDNFNEAELVESGGDINYDEEKENPSSQTLKDNETNSKSDTFCLAQGRVNKKRKI